MRTIDGRPQAFYQLAEADAANLQRGVSLLSELLFAAGAKRILLPFHGAPSCASADDARRLLDRSDPGEGLGGRHRPHDGHRARWATTARSAVTDRVRHSSTTPIA